MAGGIGLIVRGLRGALGVPIGLALQWSLALAQTTFDVNRASLAEIERLRGVGTTLAASLVEERDKAAFTDWNDLIRRVKGVGAANAARLSAQGLTVNGAPYRGAMPAAGASAPLTQ
jgi:competence protein ComEA